MSLETCHHGIASGTRCDLCVSEWKVQDERKAEALEYTLATDLDVAQRLRKTLRKQLMPYRIWPDIMPWVDVSIVAALAFVRIDERERMARWFEACDDQRFGHAADISAIAAAIRAGGDHA